MNNGEDWSKETYARAERAIGYTFKDKELLLTCFTHSSYSNNCGGESNERLEWLGDAVLLLVVSDKLFLESGEKEGKLTNRRKQYVSAEALTPIAERLSLMNFLRHSGTQDNLRGKTASSLFESVVGGIYLDGGFERARRFLQETLTFNPIVDYKTVLQEYVQAITKDTPKYRTWEEEGVHKSVVSALGKSAEGSGTSHKAAETAAAKLLYNILTENRN